MQEFIPFDKIARLNREAVITEKIDGTNGSILLVPVTEPHADALIRDDVVALYAGSRNRWLSEKSDNYGFAKWCIGNFDELKKLGIGRHYGEWWGGGIQRRYGLTEKRFSLFNVGRWRENPGTCQHPGVWDAVEMKEGPSCCHVVPTIWRGVFDQFDCNSCLEILRSHGSFAAPGFMDPEGIVIYHEAAKKCFKVTLKDDASPKSLVTPGA